MKKPTDIPTSDDLLLRNRVETVELLRLAQHCLNRTAEIMKRDAENDQASVERMTAELFDIRKLYEIKAVGQFLPCAALSVGRRYFYRRRASPINGLLLAIWDQKRKYS